MANILIVDDSRTSRKILRGILEGAGHTVVGEAKNGQEGVKMFQELSPDLVTMDITMPVVDGVDALKMIRALKEGTRIIMVTAAGQNSKVTECIKEGASDFIAKPLDAKAIQASIEKVLAQ